MGLQLGANLGVRGVGILLQQRLCAHDHAWYAIAALRGLLVHEGTLQRPGMLNRAEPLECRDLLASEHLDRDDAGKHRLAIDDHGAGAALAEPAAVLGSVELEIFPQYIQQRRLRVGVDRTNPAIDLEIHQRQFPRLATKPPAKRSGRSDTPAFGSEPQLRQLNQCAGYAGCRHSQIRRVPPFSPGAIDR